MPLPESEVSYEQEELLCSTLEIFPKIRHERRREFLLSKNGVADLFVGILGLSDPSDMTFIYERLPRMHRDFIRLLPPSIAHQIIAFVHPRDICEMGISLRLVDTHSCELASCCHAWRKVMISAELWKLLYRNLGLNSMLNQYFNLQSPIRVYRLCRLIIRKTYGLTTLLEVGSKGTLSGDLFKRIPLVF